jgi:UDP-N-acetylglucosamine 3-dehydrogenase
MSDVLSVGIIGSGGIARSHIQAIKENDNIRLAAVMDVDQSRAESVAKDHGARAYTSVDALLDDPEVEAIHVCSPHVFHGDQVVASAKAGKHVLVEKPMALTLRECDDMIQACESEGKILMVGQVMRYYPVNQAIKKMLSDGAIGDVGHLIRRRYGYFDTTQPGTVYGRWYLDLKVGGICVLYCFGPHEYDILHWYMDSPVVEVYAQGSASTELYKGQKDSYTSIMKHKNGATSVLSQTVVSHVGAHDQYIIGSEGSMFLSGDKLLMNGKEVNVEGSSGEGMRNQIHEFADCCLNGRQPDANGKSVRHTMAVIEATKQSAERNKPVLVSEFG